MRELFDLKKFGAFLIAYGIPILPLLIVMAV